MKKRRQFLTHCLKNMIDSNKCPYKLEPVCDLPEGSYHSIKSKDDLARYTDNMSSIEKRNVTFSISDIEMIQKTNHALGLHRVVFFIDDEGKKIFITDSGIYDGETREELIIGRVSEYKVYKKLSILKEEYVYEE